MIWPALPGLLVARVLSGLGIGAVTATATAWLAELHAARRPGASSERAQVVATVANLGGLGLGGLVAGVLAQWAGHPLRSPSWCSSAGCCWQAWALLAAPETRVVRPPRPRYRPQRVSVPRHARGRFFAAATGAAITFAIFGLVTSLAPSFLAGTLHQPSLALAGAVSFAMFATAALAQTLTSSLTAQQLLAGALPALLAGIGLLTLAVWLPAPSFGVFLAGDLIAGAGGGLMFKGAIRTVVEIAPDDRRAEALAGLYLAAYLGLAGPVLGLGALTQVASTRVSLLVFAVVLVLGILAAAPALLGRGGTRRSSLPEPVTAMRKDQP